MGCKRTLVRKIESKMETNKIVGKNEEISKSIEEISVRAIIT